jgi:hypothetical protein
MKVVLKQEKLGTGARGYSDAKFCHIDKILYLS